MCTLCIHIGQRSMPGVSAIALHVFWDMEWIKVLAPCPVVYVSAGDPNSGSRTRTAMTTNWAIAPTSLESISKAEPAIKLPKQCSSYFSLHVSTEIHSLYSNQASLSHFLNLRNTHLELGIAIHAVIQAMGQENCPLARATVNITLVKATLWDSSENKWLSRVRNTDRTSSFIFGKSWLSSPIHNTAQKSVLQSNTITI